uniref:LigA n=1 Tax=Parastrongyloides trichosuri TaxID=131310 RepID=A0A0N4Z865_PARTI
MGAGGQRDGYAGRRPHRRPDRPIDLRPAGGGRRAGAGAVDRDAVRGEDERRPSGGAATHAGAAARRSGSGDGPTGARADGASGASGDHGPAIAGRSFAGVGPQRLEQPGRSAARLPATDRVPAGRGSAGAPGGPLSGWGAGRAAAGAVSRGEGRPRRLHPERLRGARLFRQQRPAPAGRRAGDADARRLRPAGRARSPGHGPADRPVAGGGDGGAVRGAAGRCALFGAPHDQRRESGAGARLCGGGRGAGATTTVRSGPRRSRAHVASAALERPRVRAAAGRRRGAGGDPRRPVLLQPEQPGAGPGRGSDREA